MEINSTNRYKKPAVAPVPKPAPAPKPAVASPAQQAAAAPAVKPPAQNSPVTVIKAASGASSNAMANVNNKFVDGTVDCDSPPVQFGADPSQTLYLGGQGWLNSQVGRFTDGGIQGLANTVGCRAAQDGATAVICNYNCPGTRLPTQFAKSRYFNGINGESVGGLQCKPDNKLYRINTDWDILCMEPSDLVTVEIVNQKSQPIAICKTNYPGLFSALSGVTFLLTVYIGDEAMTIPYPVQPGETIQIPVIQSQSFYKANGDRPTTGQFYINEPGVPVEQGCIWGSPAEKKGNFVSMNLGVGINGNEMAYAGLFTNWPTQTAGTYPGRIMVEGSGINPPQGCAYDGYSGTLTFNGQAMSTVNQGHSVGCTIAVNHGGVLRYVIS